MVLLDAVVGRGGGVPVATGDVNTCAVLLHSGVRGHDAAARRGGGLACMGARAMALLCIC